MSTPQTPSGLPLPLADPDSKGFWEHAAQNELALQRCEACSSFQFPPLERCRLCGGVLHWQAISGQGTVSSFIIQHHVIAPGFASEVPYAIALITPLEAPHIKLPARIFGSHLGLTVGEAVRVVFARCIGGFTVPEFERVVTKAASGTPGSPKT
jgi:hypothetical protein